MRLRLRSMTATFNGCITPARALGALVLLAALAATSGCGNAAGTRQGADGTAQVTGTTGATATATIAGTPTAQQLLAELARQSFGARVQRSEAAYDAQTHVVTVTGTLGGAVPLTAAEVSTAQALTRTLCFQVQRALWTGDLVPGLREVRVIVRGPAFGDYGDTMITDYGEADLSATTASHFAWASLSADTAWEQYDHTSLRPAYEPNWHYEVLPTSTPS